MQGSHAAQSTSQSQTHTSQLDFEDHKAIFAHQTTGALIRALLVFKACNIQPFVQHAQTMLDLSRKVLGDRLTYAVVKNTFFKHFCAGGSGMASCWEGGMHGGKARVAGAWRHGLRYRRIDKAKGTIVQGWAM